MLMGQQLGSYTPSTYGNHWDTTLAAARAGEQAGLDSVWLADHFMFPDKEHPDTLRLVAQYADFCNVGGDPEMVAHKFAVLRQHCERVGRPYGAITRSNDVGILIAANERELAAKKERYNDDFDLIGTPDAIIEGLRRYAEVGSQYVTFHMPDAKEIEPILLLGETVLPAVATF